MISITRDDQNRHNDEDLNNSETCSQFIRAAKIAEQNGLAAAVSWFKAIRIENLVEQMRKVDLREANAMAELEKLARSVEKLIESNRGGDKGIHGFIGERAQVYLNNAWSLINGEGITSVLIDDNGMVDYIEKGINIQQKACKANGFLGLDHIMAHKTKYPMFDGKYQIPKDFYDEFKRLGSMTKSQAGKLSRHEWNLWNEIQKIKQEHISVEPMKVTYDEIQRDTIFETIKKNTNDIQKEHEKQARTVVESNKPTVKACVGTAVASSAIEGVLSGSAKVVEKRLQGKKLRDYDRQDAKEVGLATAEGSVKGAVRGAAVYVAENCTPIPGIVAGGAVTVAFDSAKAVYKYNKGVVTKGECIDAVAKSIVTASAGALGAKIGGKICPIPIVGEVVGGFLFSFVSDKAYVLIKDKVKCGIVDISTQIA